MAQARVLEDKELKKVLTYCSTQKYAARNRAIVLCTHMAGMRIGEVAALLVDDVLAIDGTIKHEISLAAHQTKGNRARTVLLPQKLRDELKHYLQEIFPTENLRQVSHQKKATALFPSQKNPLKGLSANTACQLLTKIYRESHVYGASSHSGRRTFITKLADKGVGVRVLMALAGHKSIATTQRYIDLNPTVMKAAVELI